ncbi:MAG: 4Fe-4S dicluster domain-containing protein [Ignavibacteriae bacterium]|nr:4Fe-4S dicluster domain-containing protein [Ignavibacteriota bacterium]
MKKKTRRDFLKTSALIGTAVASSSLHPAKAGPKNILSPDRMGVLVDTTVCVGCRSCEWACKVAHGRSTQPLAEYEDRSVYQTSRRPDHESVTVVNEHRQEESNGTPVYTKVQCMHCDHPSCVSACIVGAFTKEENGSVVWDTNKCIGCRYCMVACPFQIPAFEFGEALRPDVVKCDFCFSRTQEGKLPACVEMCPVEALTYGPRTELIKVARERIRRAPEKYVHHIYGETEAGGTSWMYLASRDFAGLGLPNVGTHAMPGTSESIQHGIFAYFIPPVLLYAMLGGVMWVTRRGKESEHEELK